MDEFTKAPLSGKVIQLDISTTAGLFAIPPDFQGRKCIWSVFSDDETAIFADIAFGTSTVSVTYGTADSTVDSNNITVNAATGARLASTGTPGYWVMPIIQAGVVTHFAVDASANGKLQIVAVS